MCVVLLVNYSLFFNRERDGLEFKNLYHDFTLFFPLHKILNTKKNPHSSWRNYFWASREKHQVGDFSIMARNVTSKL